MRIVLVAGLILAFFAVASPAPARAGGAAGPLRNGGAAFGDPLPVPDARPIASRLTATPRELTAGDPSPVFRLRVRQRGVTRVRARIVLVRLPGSRPVARQSLGLLPTGHTMTVRLPRALRLQTGRYILRLHVKDPRGRTLRRSGANPGRVRIVVHRPKAVQAPAAPALPTVRSFPHRSCPIPRRRRPGAACSRSPARLTSAARTPASARAAPATSTRVRTSWPRPGRRSSRRTRARSAARASSPAAPASTSCSTVPTAATTSSRTACAARRSSRTGAAVSAGQTLCQVGATGTTSGAAHLHFEIWQVGWRVAGGTPIDPLPELLAWSGR